MALLEELKPGVLLKGLLPGNLVTVIDVKRQGSICVELTYKDANGHFDSVLLYCEFWICNAAFVVVIWSGSTLSICRSLSFEIFNRKRLLTTPGANRPLAVPSPAGPL
jgi:hypothetical protein